MGKQKDTHAASHIRAEASRERGAGGGGNSQTVTRHSRLYKVVATISQIKHPKEK